MVLSYCMVTIRMYKLLGTACECVDVGTLLLLSMRDITVSTSGHPSGASPVLGEWAENR